MLSVSLQYRFPLKLQTKIVLFEKPVILVESFLGLRIVVTQDREDCKGLLLQNVHGVMGNFDGWQDTRRGKGKRHTNSFDAKSFYFSPLDNTRIKELARYI